MPSRCRTFCTRWNKVVAVVAVIGTNLNGLGLDALRALLRTGVPLVLLNEGPREEVSNNLRDPHVAIVQPMPNLTRCPWRWSVTPETSYGLREVQLVCDRFHDVVRQLRGRYDNRTTLEVTDEYDVQDLLHALLRLFFTDIRPEEWTPSYAGQSSRVDFLLKPEQILVETKKTRETLRARDVGNQLILDVARYQSHPDCKVLVCFVYDPSALISNPRGLESDLNQLSNDRLSVVVLIRPA
jgi:hypothetical protein